MPAIDLLALLVNGKINGINTYHQLTSNCLLISTEQPLLKINLTSTANKDNGFSFNLNKQITKLISVNMHHEDTVILRSKYSNHLILFGNL